MRYDTETLRGVQRQLSPHIDGLALMLGRLQHTVDRVQAQLLLTAFSGEVQPGDTITAQASLRALEGSLAELHSLTQRGEALVTILGRIADNAEGAEESAWQLWQCQPPRELAGLSSPWFVQAVRQLTSGVDVGTAFLLNNVVGLFGQAFSSHPGPDFTAAALSQPVHALAPEKQVIETRVHSSREARAPRSLAELAQRIPEADAGSPQIRIERFGSEAQPAWVVYAAGTVAMRPNARGEPWDLTSNLDLMARNRSDSQRALELTMTKAGIRDSDHVVFVGFSQGGMLAATLASSGRSGPTDLVTFGAPVSQLDLSSVDTVITVEHQEDLVPALGGLPADSVSDRVELRDSAQVPATNDEPLPAHNLQRYAETAHRLERQPMSAQQAAHQRRLFAELVGTGTSSLWRASRTETEN